MTEKNSDSPISPQFENKLPENLTTKEKSEPEKNLNLKRKRSNENLLTESPIKKMHAEKEEKNKTEITKKLEEKEDNDENYENKEEKEKEKNEENKEYEGNEEEKNEEKNRDNEEEEDKENNEENNEENNDDNDLNLDDEEGSVREENGGRVSRYEDDIDLIMKKTKKSGGKRGFEMDIKVVKQETEYIIDEMNKAYEEDIKNLQQKKPALKKIKVFQDSEKSLKNSNIQAEFIEQNGLDIFEQWLKPHPDGTQTCFFLKKKILETLKGFSLDKSQIDKNEIGKIVNKLCLSQSEPQDIRKLAKGIIDKWTRLLTNNHISYRYPQDSYEMEEVNEKSKKKSMNVEKKRTSEVDILNSQKKEVKYVLLPQKNNVEFFKNAKSSTSDKKKREVSEGTKEIYKILQNLRRNKNNL